MEAAIEPIIVRNPMYPVPEEVLATCHKFSEQEAAADRHWARINTLSRPSAAERKLNQELNMEMSLAAGLNPDKFQALKEMQQQRTDKYLQAAVEGPGVEPSTGHGLQNYSPSAPPTADFWWAETRVFPPSRGAKVEFTSSGLKINMFVKTLPPHEGDPFNMSFRIESLFGVGPERLPPPLPPSSTRTWGIAPQYPLTGAIEGHTSPGGIFWGGDSWAKCWMNRRVTLFERALGSAERIVADRAQHEVMLHEENKDRTVWRRFNGRQSFPLTKFRDSSFGRIETLWARTTMRFDVLVEGPGALIQANPTLLLKIEQFKMYKVFGTVGGS